MPPSPAVSARPNRNPVTDHLRAKKAAAGRHSLDTIVSQVVARADLLTPDQIERIRRLLPPVPATADDGEAV